MDLAALADGLFILADLVALRQVGVKIMFPGETARGHDLRADGEAEPDGELDHLAVQDRKHARQPEVHRAGVIVWFAAEGSA